VVASALVPAILAITSSGKLWLGSAGAAFIIFALLVSFVFPRRDPDFPGNRLGAFIGVTLVLFAVMLVAVFQTAGGEGGGHGQAEPAESHGTTPSETSGGATTTGGATTGAAPAPAGDPVKGKQVFASAGCVACHTLAAAGSTGNVGPNLDDAKPSFELVVDRVTHGKGAMPPFAGQLSDEEIRDVAAYVVESTKS
jgi:mono/diheme cytochrome c family protein